jgi:hypothetical protein
MDVLVLLVLLLVFLGIVVAGAWVVGVSLSSRSRD